MFFKLLFFFFGLLLVAVGAKSYCDVENSFSEAEAIAAVDAHNSFRIEMANGTFQGPNGETPPKAANMRRMSWDCVLQKSAQDWANQCKPGWSNYSDIYAENLYAMDSPSLESRYQKVNGAAKMVSEYWRQPYVSKGFQQLKNAGGVGTAVTMAWADSYQFGCGVKVCPDYKEVKGAKWHRISVVCHYNPKGNANAIGGDTAYKIGKPCSDCGQAFECEKKGGTLCVRQKLPDGTDVPFKPLPDTIGHCNVKNGYDKDNVQWIVDSHNKFRSELARGVFGGWNGKEMSKKASNMKKIAWDCKLQASAQWWAENGACGGNHSKTGGENMYYHFAGSRLQTWIDPKLDKRVNGSGLVASQAWPNEFVERGFRDYIYTEFTGHSTAMAWAETNQIGCGYYVCENPKEKAEDGFYYHRFAVVCQYRPTGNVGTQKTYKFGEPCSECDNGLSCEKTGSGLCV